MYAVHYGSTSKIPISKNAPLWLNYCHCISLHAKLTSYWPHSHENGVGFFSKTAWHFVLKVLLELSIQQGLLIHPSRWPMGCACLLKTISLIIYSTQNWRICSDAWMRVSALKQEHLWRWTSHILTCQDVERWHRERRRCWCRRGRPSQWSSVWTWIWKKRKNTVATGFVKRCTDVRTWGQTKRAVTSSCRQSSSLWRSAEFPETRGLAGCTPDVWSSACWSLRTAPLQSAGGPPDASPYALQDNQTDQVQHSRTILK